MTKCVMRFIKLKKNLIVIDQIHFKCAYNKYKEISKRKMLNH